jgi:hypothetical protein
MNEAVSQSIFRMVGARAIMDSAGNAIQIRQQVETIEDSLTRVPALVFDLSKALVETVCKTILTEIGIPYSNDDDCPALLRQVTTHVRLFPSGHSAPAAITESIRKTVHGLNTIVQGLCEIRSREGIASHGRDAFAQNLEPIQAMLAASAADSIVSFLWNTHKQYTPADKLGKITFTDNTEFNEWVDQLHEPAVQIFEGIYRHSEILFNLDREAYSDSLQDYLIEKESGATVDMAE